jgi:hypothetical protein
LSKSADFRRSTGRTLLALVPLAFVLSACGSGRDTEMAEKLARAEQAARDAEHARIAVENAAKAANAHPAQTFAEADDKQDSSDTDDSASNSGDDTDRFDNTIAEAPQDNPPQSAGQ